MRVGGKRPRISADAFQPSSSRRTGAAFAQTTRVSQKPTSSVSNVSILNAQSPLGLTTPGRRDACGHYRLRGVHTASHWNLRTRTSRCSVAGTTHESGPFARRHTAACPSTLTLDRPDLINDRSPHASLNQSDIHGPKPALARRRRRRPRRNSSAQPLQDASRRQRGRWSNPSQRDSILHPGCESSALGRGNRASP